MARTARLDEPVVISTVLFDGDETKYVRAYVYENSGVFVTSVDLLHRAFGFYHQTFVAPAVGQFTIVTIVYDNPNYTGECLDYTREGDVLFVSTHTIVDTDTIAAGVWDQILPGNHDVPNSSGLFLQVIRETVLNTFNSMIGDPVYSLPIIEQKIMDSRSILQNEINENESKIVQLSLDNSAQYTQLENSISGVVSEIHNSSADMLSYKNELISYITINTNKLDVLLAQISQLQNQTRFIAIVPPVIRTPDIGSKTYRFYVAMYDQNGAPEAPDITPSVKITDIAGTVIINDADLTQDGSKIGQYYYDYVVTSSAISEILLIVFKITEGGVVSYIPRSSEVTVYDNDMAEILNRVEFFGAVTEQNLSTLTGVDGLSILHSDILTNRNEVVGLQPILATIKAKTDLIINDPINQTDLTYMNNKIDALPSLAEIEARLTYQTSYIKGAENRSITEVFNNEQGTNNALLANDPRLAFLDAAISTRSDLTVSEIWNYGTRELTAATPLSSVEIAKIWDHLVANIITSGSIGQLLINTLDEPNSARGLTSTQAASFIAPLALEATANEILSKVADENNENQIILNHISSIVDLIKPKTDTITANAATQSTLLNHENDVNTALDGLRLLAQAIKDHTDNLPVDPAKESTVAQIPTNTLLQNDQRLDLLPNLIKLDEYVSSRVAIVDIPTDYATTIDLNLSRQESHDYKDAILNELSVKPDATFFSTNFTLVESIKTNLDLVMGSGFIAGDDLHSIRDWQLSQAGAQLTAQQIWEYGTRDLTAVCDQVTVADLSIQTSDIIDNMSNFFCRMTTTFNTNLDQQVVLCWLDINGIMNLDTNSAQVIIHDESGNEIWAQSSTEITMPGVVKFTQGNISSLIGSSARNYIMKVIIHTTQGNQYSSVQPFFTVG